MSVFSYGMMPPKQWEENQMTSGMRSDENLCASLAAIGFKINRIAKEKGWWERERNDGEIIALIHSELSEALEGLRHGNPPSKKIPKFSAVEEEMADVVIRVIDFCYARGYLLGQAIEAKVKYNAGREYKHGGKEF